MWGVLKTSLRSWRKNLTYLSISAISTLDYASQEHERPGQDHVLLTWLTVKYPRRSQYRRSARLADAITVALDYDRSHAHRGRSDGVRDRQRYRSYGNRRSRNTNGGPVPMEIDNIRVPSKDECMRRNLCLRCGSSAHRLRQCPIPQQQTQKARRNAPRYNNSGNTHGQGKPRMNMVLEDDGQVDTVVMDRVTMIVADIQEQADELQAVIDHARKEVAVLITAKSEETDETGRHGQQPVEVPDLHEARSVEVPGECGSPPDEKLG
ncbi:unnamed protein product [Phytophthora lilii]|uniref:Unnamed protein product n=1 Tax=Phytophthora lilii TaxID=2077276 RepID=A0A9W6XKZ7_9STRA|nr:unnamed protein product [Phytophthora lilii]